MADAATIDRSAATSPRVCPQVMSPAGGQTSTGNSPARPAVAPGMTRKHLGFLNFGHWIHRPGAEPDARQALDDVVAMAVAAEQENRALVEAMRAKLVEAQAQVPLALAEALRKGNLGVMDYSRLKNIEADTDMRESISRAAKPEGEE